VAVTIVLIGLGGDIDANNDSSNGTNTILGKRKSREADIEAQDSYGNTPLHDASQNGHLPVVKALLTVGVDILVVSSVQLSLSRDLLSCRSRASDSKQGVR
jgi:ankyrin repeat protein